MKEKWIIALVLAGVVVAIACSNVIPTDPGYHLSKTGAASLLDSAQAVDSATAFMLAAGCVPVSGVVPVGSVRVPVPPAGPRKYDCHTVTADSIHRIVHAYMKWEQQWIPGDHVLADYFDVELDATNLSCSGDQVYLEPLENYQIVTLDGVIIAQGQASSEGGYYAASCSGAYQVWNAIGDDDDGNPVSPQPPFDWDTYGGPGGGGTPPPPPPPPPSARVATVVVTPGSTSLTVGDEAVQPFTATAYDANHNVVPADSITIIWTTGNSAIVAKDDAASFDAVATGTATITASVGTVSGSATTMVLGDESVDLGPDDNPDGQKPDCSSTSLKPLEKAWCNGVVLRPTENGRVQTALDSMRTISSICAELADTLQAVFTRGDFRIVTGDGEAPQNSPGGTHYGSTWGYAGIGLKWLDTYYDSKHKAQDARTGTQVNLAWILAHEADHLNDHRDPTNSDSLSNQHTDPGIGLTTVHSLECSRK